MGKQVRKPIAGKDRTSQKLTRVKIKKSDVTRQRILNAARKVFSRFPYHAGSIRMVGNEGGFEHPIINYYFPTKAALFEAVLVDICDELLQAHIAWISGIEHMPPLEGLTIYLDRFLDFNCRSPEPLRIIMLNSVLSNSLDELPGYQNVQRLLRETRQIFEQKIHLAATPDEIAMFINSFNALTISYLGAGDFQAQILDMEPGSNAYRVWVKDALIFLFLPLLEKMVPKGNI